MEKVVSAGRLHVWVVLDDHEDLHRVSPPAPSGFNSLESRSVIELVVLIVARRPEMLDLFLQLDHLELTSDCQPLELLELGQPPKTERSPRNLPVSPVTVALLGGSRRGK